VRLKGCYVGRRYIHMLLVTLIGDPFKLKKSAINQSSSGLELNYQ